MKHSEEIIAAKKFFDECLNVLQSKAHDYSDELDAFSNFKKIANMAGMTVDEVFLLFISVKVARLAELKCKTAKNESRADTLSDLVNYSCLYVLWLESEEAEQK